MQKDPEIMDAIKLAGESTQTPSENTPKGKAEKKSGKRIGYNYIILKSLKESQKNDVVKCLYIKSLINFGICVIKEGTYGDSKDKEGRDIKDRLVWQKELHERLQDKVRIPRLMGSFEENGNYYLVIERIKGKPLYRICKEKNKELRGGLITGNKIGIKMLNYVLQLITLLQNLHEEGIVHRDVTAANFMITPGGKVAVIDMELSYSLNQALPSPPFQLGTHGYMSPQQEATQAPTIHEDIYSVGAILLLIWTGISPNKLISISSEELCKKIYFFIPDIEFANIIIQCLQYEPEKRPSLKEISRIIINYKQDLTRKSIRSLSKTIPYQPEHISEIIQSSITTIGSPLFADDKRGWFSEDTSKPAILEKNKINKGWFASFNKGVTGIMYMLSKAHGLGFDISGNQVHIQKALNLIEEKYINRIAEVSPGLHFGSSGIAASLSVAIRKGLFETQAHHFDWINQLISVENKELNIVSGIAGQGMAHWPCSSFLHEKQTENRLTNYVDRLLIAQDKDGSWKNQNSDKKKKATKGFARGTAGIIYYLLEYATNYHEREPLLSAKRGLDWLIKVSERKKDMILWRSASKKHTEPWWSEGAPGIALAFMKAYSLLGDAKYKEYAIGGLLSNSNKIVDNSLGQFNGLSGLGELYLEAWQTFKQDEWRERADWVAQTLIHLKKENKQYGPYWLVKHEHQPTADFMHGNSGIIHFLLRYSFPDKIGFPLLSDH